MTMNVDAVQRLQARAFHEVEGMDTEARFNILKGEAATTISDSDTGWNVFIPHSTNQMLYLGTRSGADVTIFDSEIDTVIALLQRAREILNERGG